MKDSHIFIGLSHLGLTTSLGWASLFGNVTALDKDKKIINSLKNGKVLVTEDSIKIHETGLDDLFKKVKKSYYPSTDFSLVKNGDFVFITKDTPKSIKNPEKVIFDLIKTALPYLKNNATLIILSQVPIGFNRMVKEYIKVKRPNLSFELYHYVDTIVMTDAINRFLKPERIIIGTEGPISEKLNNYLKAFNSPVFKMSYESAEITKAAINLYLASSITFANTLSNFCENFGADINEIIPALKSDRRIGQYAYIRPSLKIAGGHLERDLAMFSKMAKRKKISSSFVDFISEENKNRYLWAIDKVKNNLKVKKPIITIWGVSYKKDTSSTKNAPSLDIIKKLSKLARLKIYDPMAVIPKQIENYEKFNNKYTALENSDCLIVLTEWDEFKDSDLSKIEKLMNFPLIIDTVGILLSKKSEMGNFKYISMGTSQSI